MTVRRTWDGIWRTGRDWRGQEQAAVLALVRDRIPTRTAVPDFAALRRVQDKVSAEQLLEQAWDEHADPFTNAVRITVSALRKRLGEPSVIATVAGVGYRIDVPRAGDERA